MSSVRPALGGESDRQGAYPRSRACTQRVQHCRLCSCCRQGGVDGLGARRAWTERPQHTPWWSWSFLCCPLRMRRRLRSSGRHPGERLGASGRPWAGIGRAVRCQAVDLLTANGECLALLHHIAPAQPSRCCPLTNDRIGGEGDRQLAASLLHKECHKAACQATAGGAHGKRRHKHACREQRGSRSEPGRIPRLAAPRRYTARHGHNLHCMLQAPCTAWHAVHAGLGGVQLAVPCPPVLAPTPFVQHIMQKHRMKKGRVAPSGNSQAGLQGQQNASAV